MKSLIIAVTVLIVAVVFFSGNTSSRRIKPPSKVQRLVELLKKDRRFAAREGMSHSFVAKSVEKKQVTCAGDLHMCADGSECILQSWVCDGGSPDCDDGSDELHCRGDDPLSTPCYGNRFKCTSGRCIRPQLFCNYQVDCDDGSDEVGCPPMTCAPNQFLCVNISRCIPNAYICDGDNDCGDMSDESECMSTPCSPERPVRCESTGICKSNYTRCDGAVQCSDGSDERDCPTPTAPACSSDQFQCVSNGRCIVQRWVCDRDPDCPDGSDEVNCGNGSTAATTTSAAVQLACTSDQFQCANFARCIPRRWLCDGDGDCSDRSDEANCGDDVPDCTDDQSTTVSSADTVTESNTITESLLTEPSTHTEQAEINDELDDNESSSGDVDVASGASALPAEETGENEIMAAYLAALAQYGGVNEVNVADEPSTGSTQRRNFHLPKLTQHRRQMKFRKGFEDAWQKMTD